LFARHIHGLELANVNVGFERDDFRPAMVCADVQGLEIDNFKAQLVAGTAPARFDGVTDLVIRNSPVLKDVTPDSAGPAGSPPPTTQRVYLPKEITPNPATPAGGAK
jgi:hypothetical protein